MKTTLKATTDLTFAEPWSITVENNGYETVYVPREFGSVFTRNTKYDRHFVSFKSRRGAENFLIKHGAQTVKAEEQPEPILIRGPRDLKWNKVTCQYDLVEVTPEQIESDRQRSAFVQEFNPCGVA